MLSGKQSVLLVISAFVTVAPCYSLNFDDLLRNYLGAGTRTGEISASEQGIIKTNINTRQAQLETQMQAGVTSGQLTPQEATDLKAHLDQIANLEGQYLADGNYSRFEVQTLLDDLNNFSLRLNMYLTNASNTASIPVPGATTPLPQGRSWYRRYSRDNSGYLSNMAAFQADIDTKQAQLDAQITEATVQGRINWSETNQLRAELNRIAQQENQFTAGGRLSYRESQTLITDLDALTTRLTTLTSRPRSARWDRSGRHRNVSTRIDQHQSLLRQRINAGISSGRLTRTEANRLLNEESRIAALEERLRSTNNRLSFDEQRRLFTELDQLSTKINKELFDRQVQ